jgi:drug/metabolite transporter (DMT)-like permease
MTALWPFFSLRTFMAVTGPKTDVWVVKTVGSLLVVIGIALMVGSSGEEIKPTTICLGLFSALALALIDIYYALQNVISKIYLGDATVELIFVFL